MKPLVAACILSLSVLWSSSVHAQDVVDIPPGEDVIAAVKKGQPAPFDGQIFDISTALRWANWLNQYKAKLDAVEKKERALCQSQLEYQQELDLLEIDELKSLNLDLKMRLKRSEDKRSQAEYDLNHTAWYESVWFGMVVGVVGTTGLVVLGTQAF